MKLEEFLVTIAFYIVISNLIYSYLDFEYDFENSIAYEINQVLNGRLINSFSYKHKCDQGEENLILGKWKGLKEACECPIIGTRFQKCTYKQKLFAFCEDKPEVQPEYYYKFDTKKICVKRTKQTYKEFLLNKQIIGNNERCKEGYKCCGIVDTLNRKLCMKIDERCPITINDINPIKENKNNNTENNQILSIFKLTEYKPCWNPYEKMWKQDYDREFPFKKCSKINNNIYDNRYEKLENFVTNKYDLYYDNNIINNYPKKTFSQLEKTKVYLWGRNNIGIKYEDIKEFSYDNLLIYENMSNKYYSYIWKLSLLASIFLIILLIANYNLNRLNDRAYQSFLNTIGCLFIFIHIIFVLNLIVLVYNLKLRKIIVIEGNDDYMKEIIKILYNEIKIHFIFNMISLILILVFDAYIVIICKNIGR